MLHFCLIFVNIGFHTDSHLSVAVIVGISIAGAVLVIIVVVIIVNCATKPTQVVKPGVVHVGRTVHTNSAMAVIDLVSS